MVWVPGGVYEVGETDTHIIRSYNLSIRPGTFWSLVIPRTRVVLQRPFCIARYPGHGLPGKPWLAAGVSGDDLDDIEAQLKGTGRALCTLEQLLVAAAGRENRRYPYGDAPRPGVCDTDPDHPTRTVGGFPDCVTPLGIHDFQVRATWCRLDARSKKLLRHTRVDLRPLGSLPYVVWGGNARYGEAFHASSNFAVHGHPGTDYRYPDDDIRLCAPEGRPRAEVDARMRRLADQWVAQGQYVVP